MDTNNAKVKLRAFLVLSSDLTSPEGALLEELRRALELRPTIRRRKRQINDIDSEVLSAFDWGPSRRYLFGTLIRIRRDDLRNPLSDQILDKTSFDIRELSDHHEGETYKDHFYFLSDGKYLVTNLPGTSSPTSRIATYINWLLDETREDRLYDLQPAVRPPEALPFKKIKEIELGNGGTSISIQQERSIFELTQDVLRDLLPNLPGIGDAQEVIDNGLVRARLVLRFNDKPRDMDRETYQELVGGIAAIGNDELGITVVGKDGRKYNGSDVRVTTEVIVEMVSQQIDEEALKQQMEAFLREIPSLLEAN
nr:MAG TPA: hypothetical protein [Caudoviricetes sp.]